MIEAFENTPKGEIDYNNLSGLQQAIHDVRESLTNIASKYTVVIMIDELDRCLPDNTIRILNRCSHLLGGIDNIQIIYSINADQIEHSIIKIFGDNTNPKQYLKKFFSITLDLDNGTVDDSLKELFSDYFKEFNLDDSNYFDAAVEFINTLGMDMRTIRETFERIQLAHYMLVGSKDVTLLLFEVITAFLSEATNNSQIGESLSIRITEKSNIFLCVKNNIAHYKKINELLENWSYQAINQYVLYNGRSRRYQNGVYGRLFVCLNKIFNIEKNYILDSDFVDVSDIIEECKGFWQIYNSGVQEK